jgi:hypothetical protein
MRDVKGIRNGIAPTSIMCYSGWFSGDEDTNAIFQGSWCNDYDFEASCLLDEIIKHLKSQEK